MSQARRSIRKKAVARYGFLDETIDLLVVHRSGQVILPGRVFELQVHGDVHLVAASHVLLFHSNAVGARRILRCAAVPY